MQVARDFKPPYAFTYGQRRSTLDVRAIVTSDTNMDIRSMLEPRILYLCRVRRASMSPIWPLGTGLDEKAIEAVKQWKFRPRAKDGKPVLVHTLVAVNCRLW